MVRSALFARVSNHEVGRDRTNLILRDASSVDKCRLMRLLRTRFDLRP
jgi:hypothetical protein